VNIKLCNNSFVYFPKHGTKITRHKGIRGWNVLRVEEVKAAFPTVAQYFAGWSVIAYYNYSRHRVDILLYNPKEDGPDVLIAFEDGYPDETERDRCRAQPLIG